jgi:hypothetical protein
LLKDTVRIGVFNKKGWIRDINTTLSLAEMIKTKEMPIMINPPLAPGNYYLRFAIKASDYENPTHNSDKIKLVIH